jgi:hypothetical protein
MRFQASGQEANLGGLPGAFASFERDELTARRHAKNCYGSRGSKREEKAMKTAHKKGPTLSGL